ncbi:unnamed protein product [Parnassius apollo]|uniref:(apollo) hypothetical protein n=1 Tax=Parnassius apollo TaxID=110799 RepID=A0A8S3X819_PARAO|nr:unnamed protein product [Parnassius apollo]
MFRYNDPAEAAKLRQEGSASVMNLSRLSLLSWSTTDLAASTENLNTTLSDLESEIKCERIEAQRAELERERQQFLLQQQERQRRWHEEKEQLLQAQKKLDEERTAMEREYASACRRLSGDWRALERGWALRRRALRCRQRELAARAYRHAAAECAARAHIEKEEAVISNLREQVGGKKQELKTSVENSIKKLLAKGCRLDESTTPSPDSPASETSTESLMHLLQQCEPNTANSIKDTVDRHKRELEDLEQELQRRVARVASHRVKVERLQRELATLGAQRRGLAAVEPENDSDTPPPTPDGMKRSKSELVLRRPHRDSLTPDLLDDVDPLSAAERELFRSKKLSLSLSLDPLPSPNLALPSDETFHTASSSPKPLPGDSSPTSPTYTLSATDSAQDEGLRPRFKLGPAPPDDSDDMSSTEDYSKPRIVEGQSSSSVERSPEERHQRTKYRKRIPGERAERGARRRQVTEAEALRAMQRLCARIADQKLLVISSLENDCSKDELHAQIAVLQDLQKKYVRLEMALQYSFFDNQPNRRPIMVTPIQETPSLTLSESDMQVATEPALEQEQTFDDPLLHRLKETEAEASDNVSTSNDELPCESSWSDPLRSRRDSAAEPQRNSVSAPVPLHDPTITPGLTHPIDFSEVVSIPGWVVRGAGAGTHHEYEVRVWLGPHCHWQLLRRYRRFRELYLAMRRQYGHKVASIPFPGRALWSSEALARARRPQLEAFLRRLLAACARDSRCPLHAAPLTRDALVAFSPFFRKVRIALSHSLTVDRLQLHAPAAGRVRARLTLKREETRRL